MAAIFAKSFFDLFFSTLPETFLTTAEILTSLALAALSYFIMTFL
jgi:hypothetical protein